MIIIPAVDIKEGRCVRLLQGDFERETVYADNPVEVALMWQKKGAQRIHIVDLDGSLSGNPRNGDLIRELAASVDVPIQVGGGIRSLKTIEHYLDIGVAKVILGTAAVVEENILKEACRFFEGSIILGLDARDGLVALEGWTKQSSLSPREVAKKYEGIGLDAIVYTDIKCDGMQGGVNVEATRKLAEAVEIPIIASGGIGGIADIESLLRVESSGIAGVIVGKALYSGGLILEDAIEISNRGSRCGV